MALIKFCLLLALAVPSLTVSISNSAEIDVAAARAVRPDTQQPENLISPIGHSHLHVRHHQHHARSHYHNFNRRGTGTYTAVSGDTGKSIAAKFSTTLDALSSANPNTDLTTIKSGQSIQMPSLRNPISYSIKSGDTRDSVAYTYDAYSSDLSAANPSVNWNSLQVGQKIFVPSYGIYSTYSIVSGDTGWALSQAFGITFGTLADANPSVNWNNLQIGQIITVPAGTSPSQGSLPYPAKTPTPKTTSTTASPTTKPTSSSATTLATSTKSTSSASPTPSKTSTPSPVTTTSTTKTSAGPTTPFFTQTARVTGSNCVTVVNNTEGNGGGKDRYKFYKGDGSATSGWPPMSSWATFKKMWQYNLPYIGQTCVGGVQPNTESETNGLYQAIQAVAAKSGLDHRFILAVVIQESSGCVRVPTTISADKTLHNPGLMQCFEGSWTCNYNMGNGTILNPCYYQNILNMVAEGSMGTNRGDGLVQNMNRCSAYSGSQAYYRTARMYNSGSVPANNDLGGPGATRCYASDVANRLMGWITAARTCTLDG